MVVGLEERDHCISSHLQMMLPQTSKKGQCPQTKEGKLLPLVRKTLVDLGFEDCQFHFNTTRCPQSTFQVFILSKLVPSLLHQKLNETVSSTDVENSTTQLLNFCNFFQQCQLIVYNKLETASVSGFSDAEQLNNTYLGHLDVLSYGIVVRLLSEDYRIH